MNPKMPQYRTTRAESLAGVIIAFTVIAIVSTGVAILLHTQLRGSTKIKYYSEAYALAREGAELIQNLLDTNALRFSGNLEECWDTIDATSAENCATSLRLTDGTSYTLAQEIIDNTRWGELNVILVAASTDTLLYERALGSITIYTHQSSGGTPTKFSRTIAIQKSQTFPASASDDAMVATSVVTWELFGQNLSAQFSLKLYNNEPQS